MKQYMIYYEVIVYDIINETPTSKERELVTAGMCNSWREVVENVKELQERFKRLKHIQRTFTFTRNAMKSGFQ